MTFVKIDLFDQLWFFLQCSIACRELHGDRRDRIWLFQLQGHGSKPIEVSRKIAKIQRHRPQSAFTY